jgi:hypothetical protein
MYYCLELNKRANPLAKSLVTIQSNPILIRSPLP